MNKSLIALCFFSLLTFTGFLSAQDFTSWNSYSDKKKVKAILISENTIWAATEGGVFSYNLSDKKFFTLSKTDGLNGSPITAITADKNGCIWLGCQNGAIDVFFPSTKLVKKILGIFNTDKPAKQINELRASGDSVFAATDFGLSVININSLEFFDTYFKFGSLSSNIKVNGSFKDNLIYTATEFGLAKQKAGATNLTAPESWEIFTTVNGMTSNNITKIGTFNGSLIAATKRGLSIFNGTNFSTFIDSLKNFEITDFLVRGDSLFVLANSKLYLYNNNNFQTLLSTLSSATKIFYREGNKYFFASSNGIQVTNASGGTEFISPPGPQSNLFVDLAVDKTGKLWAASGTDVSGVGFYKLENETWTNFNTTNNSALPTNSFFNVHSSADGNIYLGNWGYGFLRIKNESEFTMFNSLNSSLVGIAINPAYIVITGIQTDSKGNVWVLNYDAVNRKTLSVITADSNWYHFANQVDSSLSLYTKLLIDQYDTKWFVNSSAARQGLYYFNENKTFSNSGDDKFGYLSDANGLTSKSVTALALDQRGDLWVGTNLGVSVITNVQNAVAQTTSQFRISNLFSLRQYSINCITVDAINRKWIGTNQGVLVMSPDGSTLLAAFDSKNSPLISDQVRSIAIDGAKGLVYIGTENGLSTVVTTAITPKEGFDEIFVYPSPFVIGASEKNILTIDGLIKDSEIKILTIEGKLLRKIITPGGRIGYWDGRDEEGDFVNSGVYLLIAYDTDGNNVAASKVSVIRK